jgi:hypothetical protein
MASDSIRSSKEGLLVKAPRYAPPLRHAQHLSQGLLCLLIPRPLALYTGVQARLHRLGGKRGRGRYIVRFEIWCSTSDGSEQEDGVKVNVRQPFRMSAEPRDKAVQIGRPFAGLLV